MTLTASRALGLWRDAVFYFWITWSAIFIGAGGLGLAGSAAFMGLLWVPMLIWPIWEDTRRSPGAPILAALAIGWICLSWIWSPYDRPDQLIKLGLLTPLFVLAAYGFARLSDPVRARYGRYALIVFGLCAIYLLIEALFGIPIATQYKIWVEGVDIGREWARAFAERMISRGASAFILVAGPMAIYAWLNGLRPVAVLLGAAALAGAAAFGVEANLVALAAGSAAAAAAFVRPGASLRALCLGLAVYVVFAPVLTGLFILLVPDGLAAMLPMSWEMRLLIWSETLARLSEAPFFGHGLDASRSMSRPGELRGQAFDLLPLHPHNAGLHIWLEAGAVGAGLCAAALAGTGIALGRAGLAPPVAAGLAFAGTAWAMLVILGYGLWQEWHHGALALALGCAFFSRGDGAKPA
ncbi:MAG: O-antigen ligase family protein [Oceanicaulis sp.]